MYCILISDNCSDLSVGKGLSKEESQIENNIINLFKKHKWYSKTWKNIDVIYADVPEEDLDIILRNTSQFSSLPYSTMYKNYDLSLSILVSNDKAMLPFEDTIRYLSYRFEELKRESQ